MGCAIIPSSFEEPSPQKTLDIACMSKWWLCNVGFVLVFAALIVKTLRIRRIFRHAYRRVVVEVRDVMPIFTIIFASIVIVLTLWTLTAPLKYVRMAHDSTDSFGRSMESYGTCQAEWNGLSITFIVILLGINSLLVLSASVLAYRTYHISPEFLESKTVSFIMLCLVQAWLLGIPLMILSLTSPQAKFLMFSCIIFVTCQAVLLLIFGGKQCAIQHLKQTRRMESEMVRHVRSTIIRPSTARRRDPRLSITFDPSVLQTESKLFQDCASPRNNVSTT